MVRFLRQFEDGTGDYTRDRKQWLTGKSARRSSFSVDSLPPLQRETREILANSPAAQQYTAIMEYEQPYESRRTDVILLVQGAVVVSVDLPPPFI